MYDVLTTAAVVDELNATVVDGRIQQVAHVDALTIAMEVYASHRRRWLVVSADHDLARVHMAGDRIGTDPERVTPLLLLLRKYARGGRIVAASQPRYERILRVSIAKRLPANNATDDDDDDNVDADFTYSELVVEMMGRRSNVIFLDSDGRIRDSIKRVTPEMSRVRTVLPGKPYVPPPDQDKLAPRGASQIDLLRDAAPGGHMLARWLVSRYAGVSPTLAAEAAYRAGLDPLTQIGDLQTEDASRITAALDGIFSGLDTGDWRPICYALPTDGVIASPIRLLSIEQIKGTRATPFESISDAVNGALRERATAGAVDATRRSARRDRLVASIIEANERSAQRLRSLAEQQALAERADLWRRHGEAIYASIQDIPPGTVEIVGHDDLVTPLDPTLSPSANAQRYFERYRKAQAATENIPALLVEAEHQRGYLDQLLLMARQAQSFDEIEALRYEWLAWNDTVRGTARDPRTGRQPKQRHARRPRSLRSERGDTILAGRTGPQNEYVTFEIAGPVDLWLHARNMPGAHVILRWAGPADDAVLECAASLAAWYSDGRESTTVSVDVTERRNVRKIRGAGPGMVTYRNERTVNVRPRSEAELGLSSG